jgi:hypothetical protein
MQQQQVQRADALVQKVFEKTGRVQSNSHL